MQIQIQTMQVKKNRIHEYWACRYVKLITIFHNFSFSSFKSKLAQWMWQWSRYWKGMDGGKVSREGCTGACTKRKEAITLHCSQGDVCALPLWSRQRFYFQFGFSHTVHFFSSSPWFLFLPLGSCKVWWNSSPHQLWNWTSQITPWLTQKGPARRNDTVIT